jgi:hypothetical protein
MTLAELAQALPPGEHDLETLALWLAMAREAGVPLKRARAHHPTRRRPALALYRAARGTGGAHWRVDTDWQCKISEPTPMHAMSPHSRIFLTAWASAWQPMRTLTIKPSSCRARTHG